MDWDKVDSIIDEAFVDVLSYKLRDITRKDERYLSKVRAVRTPYGMVDRDTGELLQRGSGRGRS